MNGKFWLIYEWKLFCLVRNIFNYLLNIKILFYIYYSVDVENNVWIFIWCKWKMRWDYFVFFMFFDYMIVFFKLLIFILMF